MAHFPDLTKYTYHRWHGPVGDALNVGWLDKAFPFETGEVAPTVGDQLAILCSQPVLRMRGFHACQFCSSKMPPAGTAILTGNGEIRVIGTGSKLYAAPALIHQYVCVHKYRPPEEFVAALEAAPVDVHLAEMRRWEELQKAWLAAALAAANAEVTR